MTAIIVITDRAVISHLAVAVVEHRRALKRQRIQEPRDLAYLEEKLRFEAHKVAEIPNLAEPEPVSHDSVVPILLTLAETAARLNVGMTTVKSLTRDGSLPTVRIGSAVRVHEADLVEFTDSLREDPRRLQTKAIS